jgi:hypothetical protein
VSTETRGNGDDQEEDERKRSGVTEKVCVCTPLVLKGEGCADGDGPTCSEVGLLFRRGELQEEVAGKLQAGDVI